jgi:hypothetical protein
MAAESRAGSGSERRAAATEPTRDEIVAAQQVVDLFATEALLALDRYEQAFPADAPDRERRVADRLAHWWRKLELADVRLDRGGTDAEQILAKAVEVALDRDNEWGLNLEEAAALTTSEASIEGRRVPDRGLADFRKEFLEAYGGRAGEPSYDDTWLAESLTRFARASLLRDVVEAGAKVRASEPLRAAADVLVEQGRQLMDDRLDLARSREKPVSRLSALTRQASASALYTTYAAGVTMIGAPMWANLALKTPALAVLTKASMDIWRDHRESVRTRNEPAQAQLRVDRDDMVRTLGVEPPATRRDLRALRKAADRRPGRER